MIQIFTIETMFSCWFNNTLCAVTVNSSRVLDNLNSFKRGIIDFIRLRTAFPPFMSAVHIS